MLEPPKVVCADSLEWMQSYDGEPFDAVITDPPYGMAFMGKSWDAFPSNTAFWVWCVEWMRSMLNVVKPGAHAAIFGSPRLFGWQATALELAGWEMRDTLMWMHGQGFPKSHNLRGDRVMRGMSGANGTAPRCDCGEYEPKGLMYGAGEGTAETRCANCGKCAPEPADKNGWGTALKPAWEPILLARAPMDGGVQVNYDLHGTGALNIDAGRVPLEGGEHADIERVRATRCECGNYEMRGESNFFEVDKDTRSKVCRNCGGFPSPEMEKGVGRWPANVVLDEAAAAMLDAAFRTIRNAASPQWDVGTERPDSDIYSFGGSVSMSQDRMDLIDQRISVEQGSTNPSRFFYTAKASKGEREAGLGGPPKRRSDGRRKDVEYPSLRTSPRLNVHPTVKPIDLGRWLTRMLVPEGGRVLDPFSGSGSFGIAAGLEGARWTGIERDEDYAAMAETRIEHWIPQERLF